MGKVVKAVVGVAVTVVGVVTMNPLLIAQGAAMTLGAILQKSPKTNAATNQRLSKQLVPEDFRKIVFGRTAGAVDLRFWEVHGANNTNYSEVIAVAGHRINSFQEFYAEEELIGFSGNAATGNYAGVLTRQTNNGAPGNAALAVGSGAYWTSASKFTGAAHYSVHWVYDEKKLPTGIPQKITQIIEGALVYDPRRDSTRGGSGPHRINNQSTWSYATLDGNGVPIGRNNALQALWYLIGWRIQNPSTGEQILVAGQGVDPVDIDIPGFIAAANDAETQQFYTDMILSTGDSHSTNRSIISCGDTLGHFLDPGGLWTYRVTKDDTAVPAVALTEDDVLEGAVEWLPDKPMAEQYNKVVGTYVDPSSTSLYQARAYPEVKDAAYEVADGFKKRKTLNFQAIQDEALAQKAARIVLNEGRYLGEFRATFGFKALQAQVWDVIGLTLDRYGFDSSYRFRVRSQSLSASGIEMVIRITHSSVYTGGSVTITPAPSALAKYDPRQQVAVTGLSVSPTTLTGANDAAQDAAAVSWTTAPGNVRRTEGQFKLTAGTSWTTAFSSQTDLNSCVIGPLLPSSSYQVRVRHVTIHEVPGAWSTLSLTTGSNGRVNSAQVIYADGTVIEVLKPEEAGANKTETRTAAGIAGQAWAATNGSQALVDNRGVPLGDRNRVPFSQFEAVSTAAWYVSGVSGVTGGALSFASLGGYKTMTYTAAASGAGSFGTFISGRFPVLGGEALACQARISTNTNTYAAVTIRYYNSSGTPILSQPVIMPQAGPGTPSQYLFQGFTTAPLDAVYGELEVFVTAAAAGALSASLSQPMVAGAQNGQTAFPAFTAGPNSFDAADVTSYNIAAAVAGQSAWTTYTAVSPTTINTRTSRLLDADGTYDDVGSIRNRRITRLKRLDGTTDVTEGMVVTDLGTSAGIAGQSAWATFNDRSPTYLDVLSTPGQNVLFNGSLQLGWTGWSSGGFNLIQDWRGNIAEAPYGIGGTFVADGTRPINVANNQVVTLSAVFTGTATSNAFYFVDIRWANGGNGGHLGYSSETSNNCILINETSTKKLAVQTITAPSASDGSGFVRGYVRIVSISDVAYSAGTRWVEQIKVEIGALATPFSDEATNPALLGSVPPSIPDNSFSYSSTTSSITISWPSITVYRSEGSTISISAGSQVINGLSDGTTYKVYPFVVDTGGASGTMSFVGGGSGSPSIMHSAAGSAAAAAAMYGRSNIPMGSFVLSTPVSGGGGGGGGGSSWCLHPETKLWVDGELRSAGSVRPGQELETPDGPRAVVAVYRRNKHQWVDIETTGGHVLTVTPEHVLYSADGSHIHASALRLGVLLRTDADLVEVVSLRLRDEKASMVAVELNQPHLYLAGPGRLLSHNSIAKL
jgi:hypothetical protein